MYASDMSTQMGQYHKMLSDACLIGIVIASYVLLPLFGYSAYETIRISHVLGAVLSSVGFAFLIGWDIWLTRYFIAYRKTHKRVKNG